MTKELTPERIAQMKEKRLQNQRSGETHPKTRLALLKLIPERFLLCSERLERIPKTMQNSYVSALAGRQSAAIKSFCLECVAYQPEEVRLCTALACPLYSVRPYTR